MAETFKYTRQHYYKQKQDLRKKADKEAKVKALVLAKRKLLPRLGGRKAHYLITPQLRLQNLKFGRDKLFKLLRGKRFVDKASPQIHTNH